MDSAVILAIWVWVWLVSHSVGRNLDLRDASASDNHYHQRTLKAVAMFALRRPPSSHRSAPGRVSRQQRTNKVYLEIYIIYILTKQHSHIAISLTLKIYHCSSLHTTKSLKNAFWQQCWIRHRIIWEIFQRWCVTSKYVEIVRRNLGSWRNFSSRLPSQKLFATHTVF